MKPKGIFSMLLAVAVFIYPGAVPQAAGESRQNLVQENRFDQDPVSDDQAPSGWELGKVGGRYLWNHCAVSDQGIGGKTEEDRYFVLQQEGLTPQAMAAAGFQENEVVNDPYITCWRSADYPITTYEVSFLAGYDAGQYIAQNVWAGQTVFLTALSYNGEVLSCPPMGNRPLAWLEAGRWYKTAIVVYASGKADLYLNGELLEKDITLFSEPVTSVPRFKIFMQTGQGTEETPARGLAALDNIRWYGGNYSDYCQGDQVMLESGEVEIDRESKSIFLGCDAMRKEEFLEGLVTNGACRVYTDHTLTQECESIVRPGAVVVVTSFSGEVLDYYEVLDSAETARYGEIHLCRETDSAAATVSFTSYQPQEEALVLAVYDRGRLSGLSVEKARQEAGSQTLVCKVRTTQGQQVKAFFFDSLQELRPLQQAVTKEPIPAGERDSVLPESAFSKEQLKGGAAFQIYGNSAFLNGEKVTLSTGAYLDGDAVMVPIKESAQAFGAQWAFDEKENTVWIEGAALAAKKESTGIYVNGAQLAKVLEQGFTWYERGLAVIGKEMENTELFNGIGVLDELSGYLLYDRPTPEKLISRFNARSVGQHPRLQADSQTFQRLRLEYEQGGTIRQWAEEWLLPQADAIVASGYVPRYERPDGLRFSDAHTMYDRVPKLALAYWFTEKEIYAQQLWKMVDALCAMPDWNAGRHFLDVSAAAAAVGIAYDWMYDVWMPQQRQTMAQAILEKAFSELEKVYDGNPSVWSGSVNPSWERMTMNWNAVCNGSMAMAAMAVMEEYPEQCAGLLSNMLHSLEYQMMGFFPDGGYREGPGGYWGYLMSCLQPMLASLDSVFGTDFGLSGAPGFADTWKFPVAMTSNLGYINNYSDCGEEVRSYNSVMGYYFWFANKFDLPQLGALRLQLLEQGVDHVGITVADILHYNPAFETAQAVKLPLDLCFLGRDVQAASMREDYDSENGVYLGLHAIGELGQDHGHLDAGNYVLDMAGFRVAVDLGADDYNLPGMFDYPGKRNWYYRVRPEGHNLFVIDPDAEFFGQSYGAVDRIENILSKPRGAFCVVDLTQAYAPKAQKVSRGFLLADERKSVTVRDEIILKQPQSTIYWMVHTQGSIEIINDNTAIITSPEGRMVQVQFITNAAQWQLLDMDPQPLPESPKKDGQNENLGVRRLTAILQTREQEVYMAVRYTPLGSAAAALPLRNVPIAQWSVPDGELQQPPVLEGIRLNGVLLQDFQPGIFAYTAEGTREEATVEAIAPGCQVEQYDKGENAVEILVYRSEDPYQFNVYTVYFHDPPAT